MKTLEWEDNKLKLIDQTKLPDELTYIYCETYQEVIVAIKDMIVRGAPAIGVSAAYGLALADLSGEDMEKAAKEMREARPTAVNLMWAVDRVMASDNILEEAHKMAEEDMAMCRAIGKYGAELIDYGDTVLTHCNADETRPRGQGARLSVWEMQQENIPVKLIPDVASGYLMSIGKVDKVVIGADRVAYDGIANKIGSLMVALAAKRYGIPFYVAAPTSTFDDQISIFDTEIEERSADEVTHYGSCRICPEVPCDLISGVITEKGVFLLNNEWEDFKYFLEKE